MFVVARTIFHMKHSFIHEVHGAVVSGDPRLGRHCSDRRGHLNSILSGRCSFSFCSTMSERLQQDASCLVCRCSDKTSSGQMVINRRHNVLSFSALLVKPASDTIQRSASAGAISSDSVTPFKSRCFLVFLGPSRYLHKV